MALTPSQIKSKIQQGTSRILLYELLPQVVRDGDPDGVIKALMEAVEFEYQRNKESIQDVLLLVDPLNINRKFVLEGNPAVSAVEQFFTTGANTTNTVSFNG